MMVTQPLLIVNMALLLANTVNKIVLVVVHIKNMLTTKQILIIIITSKMEVILDATTVALAISIKMISRIRVILEIVTLSINPWYPLAIFRMIEAILIHKLEAKMSMRAASMPARAPRNRVHILKVVINKERMIHLK